MELADACNRLHLASQPICYSFQIAARHCKMKQILVRSFLWHKTCRGWPPVSNGRNMASQAVVMEEMEAIEASEASEKKTVHRQRWQAHETMALIAAKKQQDLMGVESREAAGIESKKTKNKWKEVETFFREKGIERSAQQCQTRWFRLMSAFTQIRSWEETRKPEQPSFWSLKLDERKTMGFLLSLDQKTYNALDELYNSKADALKNVLVKDNVVEVAEVGSLNHMTHGYDGNEYNANEDDVNFSCVKGESHETMNTTNLHTSSHKRDEMVHTECLNISKPIGKENQERYVRDANDDFRLEELEECRREKHVDQCKAMENTKILSEFLQMVMDDRNGAQLPLVSTGKMEINPMVPHTGQQVESLEVSGTADPLTLCDQDDVNVKAQLLPASAEMIDGSNKDSCRVSLEECGAEEKTIVMHGDDYNVPSSYAMHDEIVQAAGDEGSEKGADGSLFKTNASNIDSLVMEGIANVNNVFASVEKFCEHQKSESHLSSTGVDALNANQSTQITRIALSSVSIDKEDGQNYSVDRILAEEARIDKNEKGEGCEVNSFLCPKNAEDISAASADDLQSNFIEAQNKNDASQMSEGVVAQVNNLDPVMEEAFERSQMVLHTRFQQQQGNLSPLLDFKEDIGTGVSKQGPEAFPRSENIDDTCNDQDKESDKIGLRISEGDYIEMIADMTQRNATMLECSTGQSFEEKKVEHLQNGSNEYNKRIAAPSESIKHFEAAVKDMDMFVEREPCDQKQSDHEKDGNDVIERTKVAIKEGDCVIGKIETRASTVDTNPPALTYIHNQFQHAPEQKSTIKGNAGSFQSLNEANRTEIAADEPKEPEFIIKDNRGTPVTAGEGSTEDQSQKTSTRSPADDDVFMNIPAATSTLVKSAMQTIRKFFKF